MATSLLYGNLTEIANNSTLSLSASGESKTITAQYTDAGGNVLSPYSISVSYADGTIPSWLLVSTSSNQYTVRVDKNSSEEGTRTKVIYLSVTPTSGATPDVYTITISQESEYNSSSATSYFKINSSQIVDGQTVDFNCDGETKSIIATYSNANATNAVPYAAWFEYEDGESVQWLTIEMTANTFALTVTGNPLGNSARTKNVVFYMVPQSGNAPVSVNITVSQVSDTFNPVFSPTAISVANGNQYPYYGANLVKTVTATGFDASKKIVFETPDWITPSYTQSTSNGVTTTTFTFTATANPVSSVRSGSILIDSYGKTVTYLVEQNANTLSVTQNVDSLNFEYTVNSSADAKTVTFTGIPTDAPVVIDVPLWITASFNSATGVLTVYPNSQNLNVSSRSYSVGITVAGTTFKVNVEQDENVYYYGHLKIDGSSATYIEKTVPKEGGTIVISATEIPTNATTMTYDTALDKNYCVACGISKTFFSISRASDTSFELVFNPQEFQSNSREALIPFYSGNCCVLVHFTQAAYSGYITFRGTGDRFLKHFVSDSRPTFIMESTAKYALSKLQVSSWEEQSKVIYPLIVSSNRDNIVTTSNTNTTTYKNYEAYKASVTSVTANGVNYNKVTMGCVAYRFKFNSVSGSTGYCLNEVMKGIRFSVRSDGWCVNGLRVAIQIVEKSGADEPYPSNVWSEIRGESDTNGFRTDLTYKGICVRKLNTTDDLYYGTTKTLTLDNIGGTTASPSTLTITANTRIFVYLTMENYTSVPNNYAYGSGVVVPTSFTFYALTADNSGVNASLLDGDWITYLDSETNGIGSDPYEPDGDGGSSETTTMYSVAMDDIYLASDGPLNNYYDVPVSGMDNISVSTINQLFSEVSSHGMHCDDEIQLNDGAVASIIRESDKLGLRLSPLYLSGQLPSGYTAFQCQINTGWNAVKTTTNQGATITEKLNLPIGCNLVVSLWACDTEFHPSKASELYANSNFWKGGSISATMEDSNGVSGNQIISRVGKYVLEGTGNSATVPSVITFNLNHNSTDTTDVAAGVVIGNSVYFFLTAYIQFNSISSMDAFTDMNCIGTYEELNDNGTKTRFGLKWTPEIYIRATK